MTAKKTLQHSCSDCASLNCYRREKDFPDFCLTQASLKTAKKITSSYLNDGIDAKLARAAAEIEGEYYGRLTRVEEIVKFAGKIGAKKIGIATCIGLMEETRIFVKILKAAGFESNAIICKIGSIDKTEIGIPEELKVAPGQHEAICNPALQAELLNQWGAELNIVVGLCVGHDTIFIRHSEAPVTYLIVKDRVLAHNPAGALYTAKFYYKRLLNPKTFPQPRNL
ncbi:MAG: DUF1847 domain-containing protein [Lentisphaerota bacterium]